MPQTNDEARITLALQTYNNDPKLSLRRVSKLYQVKYTTLHCRLNGVQARANTIPNLRKLSNLEEKVVIQYILDLNLRGFPRDWVVLKKWPTDCLQTAMCHPLASTGLETLSSDTKSSIRVSFVNMTITELNAKIQLLLMCSYELQRRLRTRLSPLPLGVQRPQRPSLRLNFNLNTLKRKSKDIIVAPQSQF